MNPEACYMYREIMEEPQAVANLLEHETSGLRDLAGLLRERDIRCVVVVARGTSDNAAQYAKYLFEYVNGIPVALAAPSIHTLYGARLRLEGTVVIGISQSGQGTDVVEVVRQAGEAGALTVGITNNPSSALANVSQHTVLCRAGTELSVAATKTYITELAALSLLAFTWASRDDLVNELARMPERIEKTLTMDQALSQVAPRFRFMRECVVVGRGFNYCTSLEAALKIKETSYVSAQPYSGADFLHGPITVVDEGFPVFLVAPPGKTLRSIMDLADELRARKAETIAVSSDPSILSTSTIPLEVPCEVTEVLSPLMYVVPLQLLSLHLALARGLNPDKPRGLSKVTLTL